MKKNFLYILVTFLVCTVSANAQKIVLGSLDAIPSFFTYNHTSYFNRKDADQCYIYDININLVETVRIEGKCTNLSVNYIDKNGLSFQMFNDMTVTQTFFNDDDDWEYMEPIYEEYMDDWGYMSKRLASYSIKKADGSVIGNIPAEMEIDGFWIEWDPEILVVSDVIYTRYYGMDYNDGHFKSYYYTLPEFRKLITGNANDVKAVPAMVNTVSKEAYDLSGRKALDNQKGIIIKDNKKIFVK